MTQKLNIIAKRDFLSGSFHLVDSCSNTLYPQRTFAVKANAVNRPKIINKAGRKKLNKKSIKIFTI